MKQVNIHYAKTHLSNLLHEVEDGKIIIIAKSGTPIAKLVPIEDKAKEREFGLDIGLFEVPENFDDISIDIEGLFYGNKDSN